MSAVFLTAVIAAGSLSGPWQISALGADRDLQVQQEGDRVAIHRVLWPEFEGQRYKLEHLYRGTVEGTRINGDLLVKEEGQAEFEILRRFTGVVVTPKRLVLDGFPLLRDAEPQAPPPPAPKVAGDPDSGALFNNIIGAPGGQNYLTISAAVILPSPVQTEIDAGEASFSERDFKKALRHYQEAIRLHQRSTVKLLHRMGQCYLALKENARAHEVLKRAVRLDPNNAEVRREYDKAKG